MSPQSHRPLRPPTLLDAFIPVGFLIVGLACAVYLFGGDSIGGPVQLVMALSAVIAGLVGFKNGFTVNKLTEAAVESIGSAMGAIFILLSVGALIGAWNISGTIATMVDLGVRILNPNWFYLTAAVICALIALGIGSSWTVMGTVGVALVGIGGALGVSTAMTAGAVISGAYFGDKMSPLSETTNLAPAVAGTDLYTHIRSMMATTIPSILIALGIYTFLGLRTRGASEITLEAELTAIGSVFYIGWVTLIPLAVVIIMAVRKAPPVVAILAGALTGAIIAMFTQSDLILAFVDDPDLATPWALLKGVWEAMASGFVPDTGLPKLDEIVGGGGMASMLTTVWLIMMALAFGGIMNACGFLARLIMPLTRLAKGERGTVVATGVTAMGINVLAADQYLAIVLTGNVYKADYERQGIAPQTLSREIEDTATVTSPLIPWNSCGAYASGVLGVATVAYLPFAFFNWINPIVSFIYAILGKQIQRVPKDTEFPPAPHDVDFYGVAGHDAEVPPVTEIGASQGVNPTADGSPDRPEGDRGA
jgi:Na+:H+ antiporter, NhaC family